MTATPVRAPSRGASAAPALLPGPRTPPVVQLAQWARDPTGWMERQRARHGRVFMVTLWPFGRIVAISDRELIKQVFTGDPEVFRAGEGNDVGGLFETSLGRNSLLLLDGRDHMRHRKLMLPPFHGRRMQAYGERMREIAERAVAGWPRGEPFRLRPRMHEITLEVILELVFGLRDPARLAGFRHWAHAFVEASSARGVLLPPARRLGRLNRSLVRFVEARAELHRLVHSEVELRRADRGGDDILSMLLEARFEDGSAMSDDELRDELMTLLMAGHETTASALSWTVELLIRNPGPLARLESDPSDEDYIDATATEALRLRPVIDMVARKVREPIELGGFRVPAGATVAPNVWLMHREPEYYPEPERFRPERFLEDSPDTYAWLPFGGGVRRCLGASFAQFEMRVVLRTMLERVRLRAADPRPEPIVIRNITLAPRRGVEVVCESR